MKFLLIGHTVKDVISYNGKTEIKPGGLFYSTVALTNLKEEEDEIFLLTSYDKENFSMLEGVYLQCNLEFAQATERMPTVHLTLFENKERNERYENITNRLDIQPLLESDVTFDGILLNMITGFELTAKDVALLKKKFPAPIYFDVHSLSRGMNEKQDRYFRPIPAADSWFENLNIIQANEHELATFYEDEKNEFEIARRVLATRPELLIKTLGKEGVRAYYKDRDEISSAYFPAIKINSQNQVGCGDVFGAAFFYAYISGKNFFESLRFANTAAGVVASYTKFEDYKNLKKDISERLGR